MALVQDLTRLLKARFSGAAVKLERVHGGERVGGELIWDGFDGQEQIDRQLAVREVVRQLPLDQQLDVSLILTLTPVERTSMAAT